MEVMEAKSAKRGLRRLMIKLPAMRRQLETEYAANLDFIGLCEAFEEASSSLDRSYRDTTVPSAIIVECEAVCAEIENEILALFVAFDVEESDTLD